MKLIRACFFLLAVLLPTSWTLAHAGDEPKEGGDMKKKGKKKKKGEEGGDMGGDKKGDMDKK